MASESPTDNEHPGPDANGKTEQREAETQPKIPPTVGPTKPKTPPSSEQRSQPCHEKKHWLDYLEAGMAGIGLIVLVAYTIFTALMYYANKKAADAAKSAADTASSALKSSEKQFRLEERPWITAIPEAIGPNGAVIEMETTPEGKQMSS